MSNCIHHWYMGTSNNLIVHARCRKCGAEKDFSNSTISKSGAISRNKKVSPNAESIDDQETVLASIEPF